jgi:hypothetical protein
MARVSQNGWPVVSQEKITDPVLFGEDFPNGWLKGDVDVVFRHLITRLHREVEPIDFAHKADDWGWYVKNIEGSAVESNHSSGTAFDYNAHTHPMGVRNTYGEADRRKIRAILADLNGVVRWGGDYTGRPDDMHFEINAGAAAVKREADRIKAASAPQGQEDEMTKAELHAWMDEWVGKSTTRVALTTAVLGTEPPKSGASYPPGTILNPDAENFATNPTLAASTALRDAVVTKSLAYDLRATLSALGPAVAAIAKNVAADDGDLPQILAAIERAKSEIPAGVLAALGDPTLPVEEVATVLRAALGSERAAQVGAVLAGQ